MIDTQLQEAIFGFERTTGVVATIKGEGGSKSAELAEALTGDKKIVVEHYRSNVAPLLNGRAKAMVVVSSRQEAVRWKLAIDKYIAERGYPIGTLIAFSGEVRDPDSGPNPFTETGAPMNPTLRGRNIREAFDTDEFQVLLVANKFQTGFDQPLLCGMYVDKRLAGIQAVQTLSRLNRMHPGKDTTYVLDFVNSADEVLEAFKMYHDTATLSATSDPHLVLDLRSKLDAADHYDEFEIERVVDVVMKPTGTQGELAKALTPVADRLMKKFQAARLAQKVAEETGNTKLAEEAKQECDALLLFRADMGTYLRLYTFLSQIFDYANTDYEKRAIFYKHLIPLLEFGREREGIDLSKIVMTHHTLIDEGKRSMCLNTGNRPELQPLTETGSGEIQEKQKALLDEILSRVNELFEGDMTDQDKLSYVLTMRRKMLESQLIREQAVNNLQKQFDNSPHLDRELDDAIISSMDAHQSMSTQVLQSQEVRATLKELLLGPAKLYEALREQSKAN